MAFADQTRQMSLIEQQTIESKATNAMFRQMKDISGQDLSKEEEKKEKELLKNSIKKHSKRELREKLRASIGVNSNGVNKLNTPKRAYKTPGFDHDGSSANRKETSLEEHRDTVMETQLNI